MLGWLRWERCGNCRIDFRKLVMTETRSRRRQYRPGLGGAGGDGVCRTTAPEDPAFEECDDGNAEAAMAARRL